MDGGIFIRCLTSVFFYDGNGVDGVYNVVMAVRLTQSFAQNQDGFAFMEMIYGLYAGRFILVLIGST
jgi:hypothetical protein